MGRCEGYTLLEGNNRPQALATSLAGASSATGPVAAPSYPGAEGETRPHAFTIRYEDGNEFTLQCQPNLTILQVKDFISKHLGFASYTFQLRYNGLIWEDEDRLPNPSGHHMRGIEPGVFRLELI